MKINQPKPIGSISLVDQVEMRLREYFIEENLQPGDPLPKEADLADAMGVSRTALREALARLKTLGLIESRRNRGIIITQPDILGSMERVLEPNFLDTNTLQDVFELRLVLELGISELLFLRKTSESLNLLEEIVNREEGTDDRLIKTRCDADFHALLYKISGNNTILRFQKMLQPIFNYVYNGTIPGRSQVKNPVTHRHLLESLRNETSSKFREKMKIHLQVYFDTIPE
ncbi:MAG: FadR family transcriptional regulator [Saprospiraceae bacterium]|nr:FadR family transcriptional regulator [Saprospiraceae bacterium]